MSFEARCHCGAVEVTIDADTPDKAVRCNCSRCAIKALVLAAVPGDAVKVDKGEDKLTAYRFHNHGIDHHFCSVCGVQPLSRGAGRDGSPMAMINLRCVPGLNLDSLEVIEFDGASL